MGIGGLHEHRLPQEVQSLFPGDFRAGRLRPGEQQGKQEEVGLKASNRSSGR
jgi:hypothetical protein